MDAISRYLELVDEVMRQVVGTERDCYSSDKVLPRFLAWVEQILTDEGHHPVEGTSEIQRLVVSRMISGMQIK